MKDVYYEEGNYRMVSMVITGCNVEFWIPKSLSNGRCFSGCFFIVNFYLFKKNKKIIKFTPLTKKTCQTAYRIQFLLEFKLKALA